MEAITTYTDFNGCPARLTDEELSWFSEIVERAKRVTGYTIPIISYDHELHADKNSRNALGICHTSNPQNPLSNGAETWITIDCYFIDECWRHEQKGDFLLAGETLEEVIAHEIAHLTAWRHGKKHSATMSKILEQIRREQ